MASAVCWRSLSKVPELEDLLTIGKITAVHGVKGTLKVVPLTYSLERFRQVGAAYVVSQKGTILKVSHKKIQFSKSHILMSFGEIQSADSAKEFVGGYLAVNEDQIIDLPEDTYFHFQLVGMNVVDENGVHLGVVSSILETSGHDVYEVIGEKRKFFIPAVYDIVKDVDIEKNIMTIEVVQGLME